MMKSDSSLHRPRTQGSRRTSIIIAAEPISIPLSSQDVRQRTENEAKLLYFTGHTPEQIKAYAMKKNAAGKRLRLRRIGYGNGTRYELYLRDWREYVEGMACD